MRSLSDVLYNFHWVEPGRVARAAQAYAGFLGPFLSARGIRAMVNLRGPNPGYWWWRYETGTCARLGIEHRDVKLNSRQLPTRDMLLAVLDAFQSAPQPFLVKCSGGQDRTSFASALYLLNTRGWTAMSEADAQFARWPYLHLPRAEQRWLRLFPTYARENAAAASLGDWIATRYAPEGFKAWLVARGEGKSFRKIYGAPAAGA